MYLSSKDPVDRCLGEGLGSRLRRLYRRQRLRQVAFSEKSRRNSIQRRNEDVDVEALQSHFSLDLAVIILFLAVGKDESALLGDLLLNRRCSRAGRIDEDFNSAAVTTLITLAHANGHQASVV